jgi:Spy/CpxP family protein refolding chaperone
MKKTLRILLPMVVLLSFQTLQAQPGGGRDGGGKREEIEAMKVGFITKHLDLTPEEAQKFWPVYNQYSNELKSVRKARRADRKEGEDDLQAMNDKDVEKMVDGEIVSRQQELDLMKKYHAQFKQVLPIKKVALLYRAEEDFKRELLQKIRERREQRR